MIDLPNVEPSDPPVAPEDVRIVLAGLKPGWYTTRDLYPRYVVSCENRDRPVASRIAFGMVMKALAEKRGSHGNVSKWYVTEELAAGADL